MSEMCAGAPIATKHSTAGAETVLTGDMDGNRPSPTAARDVGQVADVEGEESSRTTGKGDASGYSEQSAPQQGVSTATSAPLDGLIQELRPETGCACEECELRRRAADAIERLQRERDALKDERDATEQHYQATVRDLIVVTGERDAAREALQDYGFHKSVCEYVTGPCTCGLLAALSDGRTEP